MLIVLITMGIDLINGGIILFTDELWTDALFSSADRYM